MEPNLYGIVLDQRPRANSQVEFSELRLLGTNAKSTSLSYFEERAYIHAECRLSMDKFMIYAKPNNKFAQFPV